VVQILGGHDALLFKALAIGLKFQTLARHRVNTMPTLSLWLFLETGSLVGYEAIDAERSMVM
jgi:hypothetical protein